jgi:hypothetical protein
MIRPGLHPPLSAVRVNNNLLLWSSVSDPTRDRVDSLSSTLRRRRNLGELDGWAGTAFVRMASLRREPKDPHKDERPCQLFGATLATDPSLLRRGWILVSMSDPTPLALMISSLGTRSKPQSRLLCGNLKAYLMIQFPARTAWGFVFEPSSSTSKTLCRTTSQEYPTN